MLETNSWAWTDLCLTLPAELTDRDAIAGPTTEVRTALAAAETRATSNDGRSLAAELQQAIAARERWSPHGRRGGAGRMNEDGILAGRWLSNPVLGTRHVDLCCAYRALTHERLADRLFDADTDDLTESLKRHPFIEHLASARMVFNDCGTTRTVGDDDPPPPSKRHVEMLCAVITLRKGDDPPRIMRIPADIAFLGDRPQDGFVLGRSTRITAEEATDATMDVFGADLEREASRDERAADRLRDSIEEEAVRILEGGDAATLRRIHNVTRREIEVVMPAGRGVCIKINPDGQIQVRFQDGTH